MNIYVASGKVIPENLLHNGQRGLLMTDELKQFLEAAMPGLANVRVHDLKHYPEFWTMPSSLSRTCTALEFA